MYYAMRPSQPEHSVCRRQKVNAFHCLHARHWHWRRRRLYANLMLRASSSLHPERMCLNTFYEFAGTQCIFYFLPTECNCVCRHILSYTSLFAICLCCRCMCVYFIIHIYEWKAIYFKLNVNRNACAHTKRCVHCAMCIVHSFTLALSLPLSLPPSPSLLSSANK